jgi:hypothetical protein
LAPELKADRGLQIFDEQAEKKYKVLEGKLNELVKRTRASYEEFICRLKGLGHL